MEILDVVNEKNELTGNKCNREEIHKKGLWHREVVVIVVNFKKEVLLQKRSPNKKLGANKWALTAGHIEVGEEPVQAALRETEEEIGVQNLKVEDFKWLMTQKSENISGYVINNHFKNIYLLQIDKVISEFVLQESEVSEVKYVTIDDLKEIHQNREKYKNEYTNMFFQDYFLELLENIQKM